MIQRYYMVIMVQCRPIAWISRLGVLGLCALFVAVTLPALLEVFHLYLC
jgi:hypothetical protein